MHLASVGNLFLAEKSSTLLCITWGYWQWSLLSVSLANTTFLCYSKATQDTQYPPYAILKAELQMEGFAKNDVSNILMLSADWQILKVSERTWSI